jgi:ATP-dependent Lon protease
MKRQSKKTVETATKTYSVLPLRDIVMLPHLVVPLIIGRERSVRAVDLAMERDKLIFISAQKNDEVDDPGMEDLYTTGTVARVVQSLRLPNKLLKVMVEGLYRARVVNVVDNSSCLEAEIEILKEDVVPDDREFTTLMSRTRDLFARYAQASKSVPSDAQTSIDEMSDEYQKLYTMAAMVDAQVEKKQAILNADDIRAQVLELGQLIAGEIELLKLEEEIDVKVSDSIQKHQRKYFIAKGAGRRRRVYVVAGVDENPRGHRESGHARGGACQSHGRVRSFEKNIAYVSGIWRNPIVLGMAHRTSVDASHSR